MTLPRRAIEGKLSALLGGADVRVGRLRVSLARQTVLASDVTIAAGSATLRVPRIVAKVTLARLVHRELHIRSVVLDNPVLHVHQDAQGAISIPIPPPPRRPRRQGDGAGGDGAWHTDVGRLLLVDGRVHFSSDHGPWAGHQLAVSHVLAEASRTDGGYAFTVIAQPPARDAHPHPTATSASAEIRACGKLSFIGGPEKDADVSITSSISVGEAMTAQVACPSLKTREVRLQAQGQLELPTALAFVPPSHALARFLAHARGSVRVNASASYDPHRGAEIETLDVSASRLKPPPNGPATPNRVSVRRAEGRVPQ